MPCRMLRRIAFVSLAAAAWVAHAASPHELVLASGKFHEDCFDLAAGQRLQYEFAADRPVAFNLHYHRGNDAVYPIRSESVTQQKGEHVSTLAQSYCLMWTGADAGSSKLRYAFTLGDVASRTR